MTNLMGRALVATLLTLIAAALVQPAAANPVLTNDGRYVEMGSTVPAQSGASTRRARGHRADAAQWLPDGRALGDGTVIGSRASYASCMKRRQTRRLYCGCASAEKVGLANEDGYWDLAAHWFEFPVTAPRRLAAAVRRGHVTILDYQVSGTLWMAWDFNSGNGLSRHQVVDIRRYAKIVDPSGRPRHGSYAAKRHKRHHRVASR